MAKRFLVPLDRSTKTESIVTFVAGAARDAGGTVRLMHVAPVPGNVIGDDDHLVAYADQEMARVDADCRDYLANLAAIHLEGLPVEYAVRFGEPAVEILKEAEESGADVIAVSTKCRSGVTRQLLGSVAEEVLRKAPMTVVVFRPAE
jgi:nucleotide-binding universal stress UspA family protein